MFQGANAATGTDAHAVFGGKVDATGLISYSSSALTLTFSGLRTDLRYEVVVFGNRAEAAYADRTTKTAIDDATSFLNASTTGSDFSGQTDASTGIVNGDNTSRGYVARFAGIDPGTDGDFTLTVYDNESPAQPKFYANAVMLKATVPSAPGAAAAESAAVDRIVEASGEELQEIVGGAAVHSKAADMTVFDRATGTWLTRHADGSLESVSFGWNAVTPLGGDFDGDGQNDIAVYYDRTGTWYLLQSAAGLLERQFGWADAQPVPADYDGDGITDLAVYHQAGGKWYFMGSSSGFAEVDFGGPGMEPVR